MRIVPLSELSRLKDWARELTPEELAQAYRLARESFTAADLQKFTEPIDDSVPMEELLRDLDEITKETESRPE